LDAHMLLGTDLMGFGGLKVLEDKHYTGISDADVPDSFDARTHWPGLIHAIRDQQRCGSCWAFSATEVLSDRASIAAGKATPVLSPEDLVHATRATWAAAAVGCPLHGNTSRIPVWSPILATHILPARAQRLLALRSALMVRTGPPPR